jgi:hypothetical protein
MSIAEKAVEWAVGIASNSSHGYDQTNRWGPNYDCSSLVISAYEYAGAGVKSAGATYTGNMKNVFLRCGFKDVTGSVNRSTGAGLQTGDILLHEKNHTAMFIGAGKIVHASGNERGGITGGQTGDQTGGEICVRSYYNYPWDCVLRLVGSATPVKTTPGTYVVKSGDSFWSIAEKLLGSGSLWKTLVTYNGLSESHILHPGDVIKYPVEEAESVVESEDVELCFAVLPLLRKGDNGMAVRSLQTLLTMRGVSCPVNGEFGEQTDAAVRKYQTSAHILVDGEVGPETWAALIGT